MKYFFTFLMLTLFFSSKSQTPQCLAYHGCGGATVVAYRTDATWTNITYDFQRLLGGSWVSIAQSIENFHLVIPGDIFVATQYRTILHNNITNEDRISNGVTVDPAKFNDAVTKPNPTITFYWGTPVTSGLNYIEVVPGTFGLAGMRPPFTYTIKKKNSFVFDQKISTTGIFFTNNIEPGQDYIITVTDHCGQADSIRGAFGFAAFGRVTARNCSGASIELSSVATGQNVSYRSPVTFAIAPLADSIDQFNVPVSILASLNYSYPAGISTGFTASRYVVRAKDAYGVLSSYSVVSTGLNPGVPFITTIGPSAGYCNVFVTLSGNQPQSGIRRVGDNQPYTFTPGPTITGIRAGFEYEIVIKDSCGRVSQPLIQSFAAFPPRITNVSVSKISCSNTLTVTATSCTNNPEYRLQIFGQPPGAWQSSNVFTNVPGNSDEYQKVFARDGNSPLDSNFVYVPALTANVEINQFNGLCGERAGILVRDVNSGTPPYQYAISYDGINFTPFSSNNNFTWLVPGTYDVVVKDSCGNIFRSTEEYQRQVGDWFYVNETGFQSTCTATTQQAGGFIKFGIQQPYNIYGAITTPYQYELKEVTSSNGNSIQYGKVVRAGQTSDTTFTISGLPGGKGYGIFIINRCGDPVTSKNRAVNNFFIPLQNLPEPLIAVNKNNCSQPFIEVSNLPAAGVVKIFTGRDTTGAIVPLAAPNTSTVLAGGYYTIKVSTPDFNGCPWMNLYEAYVSTGDSTSAGTFDVNQGSICKADSAIVELKNFVIGQTPGGSWSGSIPDSNWINRDSGQFSRKGLSGGMYDFEYNVQTLCGLNQQLTFSLSIDLAGCGLSTSYFDAVSASSIAGCKNYEGNEWYDVLDEEGRLRFSINPGDGNNLQSVCWGARYRDVFSTPRTITLNSTQLFLASRNFYIEPNQLQVGSNPVKVRLYYSNDDVEGLLYYLRTNGYPTATVNDFRILKKSAGPGSPIDLDVTVDAGAPPSLYSFITPTVQRLGIGPYASWYFEFEVTSFSELALFYSIGNPLPVTWLSVSGTIHEGKSFINWSTASESNTSSFTVEHGADGINFATLNNLPAAGHSNIVSKYSWIHAQPKPGINYYRIRQTDKDGRYSYSKIVSVQYRKDGVALVLFPNPAREKLTVLLPENPGGGISNHISIYNTTGQVVYQQTVATGTTQFQVNISHLPKGFYKLLLAQTSGSKSVSFIKD